MRHAQRAPVAPQKNDRLVLSVGTVYTCPMHPEVHQHHPGTCPKCGMTLEPVVPEPDEPGHPERAAIQPRCWWTLPLAMA